jgi:hypothetical protein
MLTGYISHQHPDMCNCIQAARHEQACQQVDLSTSLGPVVGCSGKTPSTFLAGPIVVGLISYSKNLETTPQHQRKDALSRSTTAVQKFSV